MKSFVRFILSLCLFLVIGSGHLNAHSRQDKFRHATISRNKGAAHVDLCTLRTEQAEIRRPGNSGRGRKQSRPITVINESSEEEEEEEEDEEEKQPGTNRIKESNTCFFASFYCVDPLVSDCQHTEYPTTGKHHSFTSSFRHIYLRVIRI